MTELFEVPQNLAGTLELPEGVSFLSEPLLRHLADREGHPDASRDRCRLPFQLVDTGQGMGRQHRRGGELDLT